MYVLIFCTTPEHFSFQEEMSEILSKMYMGLHVQQILMKPEFYRQIFEKYLNAKYHEISSSVAELFHAGEWADGRKDR
jgi:stalled ribosome rescue protein Dom34